MSRHSARYPSLHGRHVLVSGGASGIGASLVGAFAGQGCRVTVVDRLSAPELIAEWPRQVRERPCDVTDTGAYQACIRSAIEDFGPVDVLINNAALDDRVGLLEMSEDGWDRYQAVNLRHYLFATQAVVPAMREQGSGVVLNIGSISWRVKSEAMPAYTAAKAALAGLTRPLARELGPLGIRVNTLSPGATLTERQARLWRTPEAVAEIQQAQSIKGDLLPEDVAAFALFLCSDDARMCTGQDYVIDGGWT